MQENIGIVGLPIQIGIENKAVVIVVEQADHGRAFQIHAVHPELPTHIGQHGHRQIFQVGEGFRHAEGSHFAPAIGVAGQQRVAFFLVNAFALLDPRGVVAIFQHGDQDLPAAVEDFPVIAGSQAFHHEVLHGHCAVTIPQAGKAFHAPTQRGLHKAAGDDGLAALHQIRVQLVNDLRVTGG